MKNENWVDFKEIKQQVSIEMILDKYGIETKKAGNGRYSCCPIHNGHSPKQFSVNFEKNIWNCFGDCKTGGNVLDLVAMKEFGDKSNDNIRKAGLLLKDWFALSFTPPNGDGKKLAKKRVRKKKKSVSKRDQDADKVINKPLGFTFKHLKSEHAWFKERDISKETVKVFGLGLQEKGKTMPGRIAIPIHNEKDELVAYCGRAVNDEQIKEDGKYKQPGGFLKSHVVYNLNRQDPGQKILILVESFISVWRLHQAGIKNVVCLMGSKLCEAQVQLIFNYFKGKNGGVLLMFDNDEDGEACTKECLLELSQELFVKKINYIDYGKKPHLIEPKILVRLVKAKVLEKI